MTALTPIRTKAETALMAQFEALRGGLPGGSGKSGLATRAKAAHGPRCRRHDGLPHRRIEAYHYTDLRNLLREVGAARAASFGARQAKRRGRPFSGRSSRPMRSSSSMAT